MRDKMINLTRNIFAYGMSILLVACLIAACVYIIALIVGQPASVTIHEVMSTRILPFVYYGGITISFIGIINLYLNGKLLFRLDIPKREKRTAKSYIDNANNFCDEQDK